MKFKSACHVDVIAINSVIARKLCSFTRISVGSTKYLSSFCTILQAFLKCISTYAGVTSSLHKFCRDHRRQKSNTYIKMSLPHQQHHIGSRNQCALRRCRERTSIIFADSCAYIHLHTTYQHTILIAGCPGPLVPPGKTGKEFICCSRVRAAA